MTPTTRNNSWPHTGRSRSELLYLIQSVKHLLKKERSLGDGRLLKRIPDIHEQRVFFDFPVVYVPAVGSAIFIGDTHGDSLATRAIIRQEKVIERLEQGEELYVVWLGDYADRGLGDIRNLELILSFMLAYPRYAIMLRGNHEETAVGQYYGLLGSCIKQYGFDDGQQIFKELNDLFEKLPSVLVTANGIVAVHGGVPATPVSSLLDLQDEESSTEVRWNDPTEEISQYVHNYKRGTYFLFGEKVFDAFMTAIGGRVLVRSHEYVSQGYKLLFHNRLLTIFSNGGSSTESGYRDFILKPKYAVADLAQDMTQWSRHHIMDIKY